MLQGRSSALCVTHATKVEEKCSVFQEESGVKEHTVLVRSYFEAMLLCSESNLLDSFMTVFFFAHLTHFFISDSGESCGAALNISQGRGNTSENILCGHNVSYTCSENYVLNGSSMLHCTPERVFHPEAPICVPGEPGCSIFYLFTNPRHCHDVATE